MNSMECVPDHGWMKYGWLAYLVFVILAPIANQARWPVWLGTGLAILVFLYLYFSAFRARGRRQSYYIAGMALLGFACLPFNSGATTFVIYAAAFIGFAASFVPGVVSLSILVALTAIEMELLAFPPHAEISLLLITGVIGLGNIYFGQNARTQMRLRKADEEIKHLAKVAERERIARDLHDVLGHTLSLIVLKSELASRLVESDPARAAKEIRDVENVSRQALAEVRIAIGGYRSEDLGSELRLAMDMLDTAGIDVETDWGEVSVSPPLENVLALALREAVLNVVRHSQARRCRLRLLATNGVCRLEVEDDGRGAKNVEGNGLLGMRERVEALGGALRKEIGQGTLLTITIPLAPQ